ncbi:MAG: XRE family transcriptional regulator [Geminocystis sp.]|nr:XRE family transcriptional regulator [Geminocystis sp.]HIK38375.1 XRE family transcriptional regulator [Geminocystis sp. M7585_C2015_104]MCS7147719.1 XRE family transcriptional regulator [Geminocystis sp.]MCX8079260.1 XRE family transcriptional regulator [Geminocystis sp.]MDW8116706.1 XRE family transcriptional regulator [Geminocystis sp.]
MKNTLRHWREKINCDNYRQWSRKSKVPELQFYRLENGLLEQTPLGVIRKIAESVGLPLDVAIRQLTQPQEEEKPSQSEARQQFQEETLSILESLLLQLPTFVDAIRRHPDLPASRLLPFLQPLYQLLKTWGIEPIGQVGEIVRYNPQEHELMEDTPPSAGDIKWVRIRYVGYRQGARLLYRARVSPVESTPHPTHLPS